MCQIVMIVSLTKRYMLGEHVKYLEHVHLMHKKYISLRQRNNHDDLTRRSEHIQENMHFGRQKLLPRQVVRHCINLSHLVIFPDTGISGIH